MSDDYLERVREQLAIDGEDAKPLLRDLDATVDVVAGGSVGETVSRRCALAARAGRWWGKIACRFLSWAVQTDHCELTLDPTATVPDSVYARAGIWFAGAGLLILALLAGIIWGLWCAASSLR